MTCASWIFATDILILGAAMIYYKWRNRSNFWQSSSINPLLDQNFYHYTHADLNWLFTPASWIKVSCNLHPVSYLIFGSVSSSKNANILPKAFNLSMLLSLLYDTLSLLSKLTWRSLKYFVLFMLFLQLQFRCDPLARVTLRTRRVNGEMCWDVLARVSGAHFNWIVLISQPLTVLIIQMVRVVDVDYITLNHAVAVLLFLFHALEERSRYN